MATKKIHTKQERDRLTNASRDQMLLESALEAVCRVHSETTGRYYGDRENTVILALENCLNEMRACYGIIK